MIDDRIRAAFPLSQEPTTLDAKIDRALAHRLAYRKFRRRVLCGASLTAGLAFAFVAAPAVKAQASLSRILRALDKQTHARVLTYNVDESGRRWLSATTQIANGDVATTDARGTRQNFDVGDKSYSLDPTLGRFIVHPRRPGGSIRLSDMLSGASGFSIGKRADLQNVEVNGRPVVRATIMNRGLPERYVIDADPESDLPVGMRVESLERGAWRLRSLLVFDYTASLSKIAPDLRRFPPTTQEAADAEFESAMTRTNLGATGFKKGRLVVRALDLAQDGTVFVAFQTGDRRPRSWSGYSLTVGDDRGTTYDGKTQFFTNMEGPYRSPDGKLEMEMFVPLKPVPPDVPRTLILTTHTGPDGRFVRMTEWTVNYPDGHSEKRRGPNYFGNVSGDPITVPVLRKRVSAPTCDVFPAWAARIDPSRFGNPIAAEMGKAEVRSRAAMNRQDWPEAEAQLEEVLRLKREHERAGYSSWRQDDTLSDLERVRAAMQKNRRP